jgi:DNA-binding protein YbaB
MGAIDEQRTAQLQRMAAREVTGASVDERVLVRVDGAGTVVGLRLQAAALQRYDHAALSDLITRTVRDTQLRARAEHARAVQALFDGDATA